MKSVEEIMAHREVLEKLKDLEWSVGYSIGPFKGGCTLGCPSCGNLRYQGHEPGCRFKNMLDHLDSKCRRGVDPTPEELVEAKKVLEEPNE